MPNEQCLLRYAQRRQRIFNWMQPFRFTAIAHALRIRRHCYVNLNQRSKRRLLRFCKLQINRN